MLGSGVTCHRLENVELARYWGSVGEQHRAQRPLLGIIMLILRVQNKRAKLLPVVSWETDCMTKEF